VSLAKPNVDQQLLVVVVMWGREPLYSECRCQCEPFRTRFNPELATCIVLPLVPTLDPSRMDSVVTHRQYVGFKGGPTGHATGEPDVRSAVWPSTEGSIAFPILWEKRNDIERAVRNFKQIGLPIVHLWGSRRSSLALGVNPKRVPGIYFTQTIPN